MSDIIQSYIYTMDCAAKRMKWYHDTGETKYLIESEMYLRVANIYMKDIMSKDAKEHPQYV